MPRHHSRPGPGRLAAPMANAGLVLAVVAGLALLAAGPGHRLELWSFMTGFTILRWAAYCGAAAAVLALVAISLALWGGARQGLWRAIAGAVLGLVVLAIPLSFLYAAMSVPPIHDITTDLEDPPAFEAALPLRGEDANPAAHGGAEVAAQQRAAYPDIGPVLSDLPPDVAFDRALAAAEAMGWEIVAAEAADRRIEAVDESFWFGFEDDVVIRVRPANGGSRIDVRSQSRVGIGDVGVNADRIRAYVAELTGRLDAAGS